MLILKNPEVSPRVRFRFAPVVLWAMAGMAISVVAYVALRNFEQASIETELEGDLKRCCASLENVVRSNLQLLDSMAFLFAGETADGELLQRNADPYFSSRVGSDGMVVALAGPEDRSGGRPGYRFRVLFGEAFIARDAIPDIDWNRHRGFRDLVQAAEKTGETAAGVIWESAEYGEGMPTLAMVRLADRMISEEESPPLSRETRARLLVGYASVRTIFEQAFGRVCPFGVDLAVFDESSEAKDKPLYSLTRYANWDAAKKGPVADERRTGPPRLEECDFAGLDFRIAFQPRAEYYTARWTRWPWYAFASGLGITAILILYILSSLRRRIEIERLVAQRTASLKESNVQLEHEIARRKTAEERLRESVEKLQKLSGQLQTTREEERLSVARAIHDHLGQVLTGLKMDAAWLLRRIPPENKQLVERTEAIRDSIENTVKTVRGLLTELRPALLEDMGLAAAVEQQAEEFEKRTGIECELDVDKDLPALDDGAAIALFRIVQEGLTNIARHAEATKAGVRIHTRNRHLHLEIADNGKGILPREESASKAFGLLGIRERVRHLGGEVEISSEPNRGTTLKLSVPTKSGEDEDDSSTDR